MEAPEISQNGCTVWVSGRIEMDQRQDHPPTAEASLNDPRLTAQSRRVQKNAVALLQIRPTDDPPVRDTDICAEGIGLCFFVSGEYPDLRILDLELRRPPETEDGRLDIVPDLVARPRTNG